MRKEVRTIVYDEDLRIEAYCLNGIVQPFPNHFHEYYVIGLMEGGQRFMTCKNHEYTLKEKDIVLFNPRDNHCCAQSGEVPLSYCALNITTEKMLELSEEITGVRQLPGFSRNVVQCEEAAFYMRQLHPMIMDGASKLGKEENLILLVTTLLTHYGQPFENCVPECSKEVEQCCAYIEAHLEEHLSLEQLCDHVNLSKSTLLRGFTKYIGITPYRYLQTVRINAAKKLLEKGMTPVEAALQTGFSDQSHFTNYFTSFIGLAPGVYRDIFVEKEKEECE